MQLSGRQVAWAEVPDYKTREQAVYESLRQAISRGRWGPDEPLAVNRICVELNVSRITVSNALKRLAGEGFVRLAPHKEAVVARMEPGEIREIYLMWAELETLATREATEHITAEHLIESRRLNEIVRQRHGNPPSSIEGLRAADRAFHRHVRQAARMARLDQHIENLADQCAYYRSRLFDASQLGVPDPAEHAKLLDVLAVQDVDAAAQFMRDHVLRGMRSVLAMLERNG